MIFAATNDKSFTDYEGVQFQYKDSKSGILFETQQILEDSLFLLRFNCPDPSCDGACRNWSALKAHVKSSHHRYLWYLSPPRTKTSLTNSQFSLYTTQKSFHTRTYPLHIPRTLNALCNRRPHQRHFSHWFHRPPQMQIL